MTALIVITGASRGIGAALARRAVAEGHRVLAIARSDCPHGESIRLDLGDPVAIEQRMPALLARCLAEPPDAAVLVNNAATIEPIGSDWDAAAALTHVALNLVAPMVLSQLFLRATAGLVIDRRIVNIGSGASTRAFDGWSLYGASKAGLDQFGRCLALEQERATHPADVVTVGPGVVDTEMQARIRAAEPAAFPLRPMFEELKAEGRLADPDAIADRLLRGMLGRRRYAGAVLRIEAFGDDCEAAAPA
jgi:benzil reductase ((S)-benzoin forming)